MEPFRYKITDENGHSQFLSELLKEENYRKIFLTIIGSKYNFGSGVRITFEEQADTLEGKGRIDLFMHDPSNSNALLIENKINANDQPKQLERYSDWAKANNLQFELYYLTPYGSNPSQEGLGRLDNNDIKIISYKNHIRNWLNQCLNESDEHQDAIQGYIALWNQYFVHNWRDEDKRIYELFEAISNKIPTPIEYTDEAINESHMPYIIKGYIDIGLRYQGKDINLIYDKNEKDIFLRMKKADFETCELTNKTWEKSNTFYDYPIAKIESITQQEISFDIIIQNIKKAFENII